MVYILLSSIGLLGFSLYLYCRYKHSYWTSKGIQSPPCPPIIGHLYKLLSPDICDFLIGDVYKLCRSGICGTYEMLSPVLQVGDPELIKAIMVKDFDHFTDRRISEFHHERDQVLNNMVINFNGEKWKNLRSLLTPAFTSGQLRSMFDVVSKKADILVTYSLQEATKKPTVDVKANCSRFILDAISTCAFGFEADCINNEDSIFAKRAELFTDFSGAATTMKFMLFMAAPTLFKALNLSLYPEEILFFNDLVDQAIAARRAGEKRGDFLDLLLEAQSSETDSKQSSKIVLDDKMILSQAILFILAGFDTTATTIAFASFLLAKYPEEQTRLRKELQEMVKTHGGFTYQGIMESKFLDACIHEALRRYPVTPVLERICTKAYQIPGTMITIKPGDLVQIPIVGLQLDEQYWPEPEVYKPDRFMPENKDKITNYTYLPFGVGPRNCIAMRFALMETRIALAKMILSTNLDLAPGHDELKLISNGGVMKSPTGVQLVLTPLTEK